MQKHTNKHASAHIRNTNAHTHRLYCPCLLVGLNVSHWNARILVHLLPGKLKRSMHQTKVFILIAASFDERAIVDFLCTLRAEGIATQLVSLAAGLLTGTRGLTIKPDLSLTQFEQQQQIMENGRYSLIIASGQAMDTALQTDPRLQTAIENTLTTNNLVAFMAPVSPFVAQFGQEANLHVQTQLHDQQFMTQIINRAIA